jgi:hypothetical protein
MDIWKISSVVDLMDVTLSISMPYIFATSGVILPWPFFTFTIAREAKKKWPSLENHH